MPVASISASDAGERFAFLGAFVGVDNPVSSEVTRKVLGWEPAHPGLIEDLEHGHYFGQGRERLTTARLPRRGLRGDLTEHVLEAMVQPI